MSANGTLLIEIITWFGLCCAIVIALALTALIVSLLFVAIDRSTMRWLPMFRVLYRFYLSLPKTRFAGDSRYYLTVFDREKARFTYTEALTEDYQNEDEHRRARDELRQRLQIARGVSE